MSKKDKNQSGVVYSTNPDFEYQHEQQDETETLPPAKQKLFIYLDVKQRAGKAVTIIENFIGKQEDLDTLAKTLKTKCGVGGSVKDNQIILQGDFRQKAGQLLNQLGYKTKIR
jgi:translation initiation factor 1